MATKEKIYIPTYISSVNYNPARVLPRLLFYNGTKGCDTYYIQSGSSTFAQSSFPYFDNYSGQQTDQTSLSLLFNNEVAPYGEIPSASLYTTYWESYVNLLYNPRTRVVNASAIIPLADYFQMELNDIVEWRGNMYHLRAINDYSLTTGECNVQLLGPLLEGALTPTEFSPYPPPPPEPTQFTYTRSAVSLQCSQSAQTDVWSYDTLSDGYYLVDGSKYYIATASHSTLTTEIIGATPSSCTPVPATQYTYVRYDLDGQCSQSNATNVWSFNSYANGYWASGSTTYYLATGSHSTLTNEFKGATASSCSAQLQFTYFRYNVDSFCTKSNSTPVWSYTAYTDGYYTIDGNNRYLETGSHSTINQQITSATPYSCTPATRYTYTRYDVSTQCSQSAATDVWSLYEYTENYYTQGATRYYIVPAVHTTYTTEFVASATSSCTAPANEYYYLGKKYDCATCTEQADVVIYSTINPVPGDYYSTDGTFSYKPQSSVGAQAFDVDISSYIYTQGATCADACANY